MVKRIPSDIRNLSPAIRAMGALLCTALVLSHCSYDSSKNKRDPEKDRTLYLLLTRPTDSQAADACAAAEDQALQCEFSATSSNFGPYQTTLSSIYGVTVNGTDGATICAQVYSSSMFHDPSLTITAGAKVCQSQCNLMYWQNLSASCTFAGYNQLLTDYFNCGPGIWNTKCQVPAMKNCLQNCYMTGTPLWFIE